jgi:hypothetical protein
LLYQLFPASSTSSWVLFANECHVDRKLDPIQPLLRHSRGLKEG